MLLNNMLRREGTGHYFILFYFALRTSPELKHAKTHVVNEKVDGIISQKLLNILVIILRSRNCLQFYEEDSLNGFILKEAIVFLVNSLQLDCRYCYSCSYHRNSLLCSTIFNILHCCPDETG